MSTSAETVDLVKIGLEVISIVGAMAAAWISFLVKNTVAEIKMSQLQGKEEFNLSQNALEKALLANQILIKETLTEKITDQKIALMTHEVLDNGRFRELTTSLLEISNDLKELTRTVKGNGANKPRD